MTEQTLSVRQSKLPKPSRSFSLSAPLTTGGIAFAATLFLGFGWLVAPMDVQMVWTMFAQAVLFSLAIATVTVDIMRLHRTQSFMPGRHVLIFVPIWVGIGLLDLLKAYECLLASSQW